MGIICQIDVFKPPNIGFLPGDTVSGVIRYTIQEPMEIKKIVTSLKGNGHLSIKVRHIFRSRQRSLEQYTADEDYVDIDKIVCDERKTVAIGRYEAIFNFKIPENVPATLFYEHSFSKYKVKCQIAYYIRIKFVRPGLFACTKHFKKDVIVVPQLTPKLIQSPITYEKENILAKLFSRQKCFTNLKVTVKNSIIPVGGTIQVVCHIRNISNIVVQEVIVRLIEINRFKAPGYHSVKVMEDVPGTFFTAGEIASNNLARLSLKVKVPNNRMTFENSKMFGTDYFVRVEVKLPVPHKNIELLCPVEIGMIPLSLLPESEL